MIARSIAALVLVPGLVHAWDPSGHMLIGQIAWELCPPSTRAKVNELVATLDHRFNGARPYHFVTVGCWMDDLRSLPRNEYIWSKWHYVDGPKTGTGAEFTLPEPPHVVWAIGESLKTLRDSSTSREERGKALGQMIHWMGDVHQPMHATTWDDRGGNGYAVMGVPFTDLLPGMSANLHTFWDKAFRFDAVDGKIVELWNGPDTAGRPGNPGDGVIATEAAKLLAKYPKESLGELGEKGGAEAWAKESHIIGCTKAYPSGDHPRDTEVRKLEPEFVHASRAIAERRIVIAGHRLAALLAELFP